MDREGAGESAGHAVAGESIGLWWRAVGQVASSLTFSRQQWHSDGLGDKPHDKWTQARRTLIENGTDAQKMAYNVLNPPGVYMLWIMYSMNFFYEVKRTYLPLLEGLSGQVASASSLKQGNVASGLDISVLLQLRQNTCSEKHLQIDRPLLWDI